MPAGRPSGHRGLTLVESMVATAILAVAITGIFSALAAGQSHARASADELAAGIVLESIVERIGHDALDRDPLRWNGHREAPGGMVDERGTPLHRSTIGVGREVAVTVSDRRLSDGPAVEGRLVEARAFDATGRELGILRRWIPVPEGGWP
mgnify:CR=1 FL=1